MSIHILYNNPFGRMLVVLLQRTGVFLVASRYLRTGMSRRMISGYIKKHQIDMSDFEGQEYKSFAEFFARKKENAVQMPDSEALISPCDGLLSIYQITEDMNIAMKGSQYRLIDLVKNKKVEEQFNGGICMVFRLQASDYHHFCAFDDVRMLKANYIPGELHSVQPIACEKIPVYRLNRRWWSELKTAHFGSVVQVEVGAMLVGDVHFVKGSGLLRRGEEMGNFELAGSTILLLFSSDVKNKIKIKDKFLAAHNGATEIPVVMREEIGVLKHETF